MEKLRHPIAVLMILLAMPLFATASSAQDQLTAGEKNTAYVNTDMDGEEYEHVFKAKPKGENEVPPVDTKAHGNFVAHVDIDYTGFRFNLVVNNIRNVVAAHIHLGMPGENGPPVATLYGPVAPGGGKHNGLLAKGVITASDLMGPLEGMTIVALVEEIKAGNAYINVHTSDGEGEDNTGPGDMASGEIRDQIEIKGMLPPALARLQVIHNAADPAASEVDIYVNEALLLNDFAFRAATPYIDVPAGVELVIGVAPGTSTGPGDILATFPVTLDVNETYAVIANGVLDPSMFAANPDGLDIAFTLFAKAGAREAAMDPTLVDFFALHGSTDAPTVDVIARGVATLVDDAAYGDMTGYVSVPPASYILDVTPGADNTTIVASFEADLSGLAGGAAVVFASGFLTPADNQNGAAFGLFAALPNGTVVEFPALTTARLQVIHNAADPGAASVDIYVNDVLTLNDFAFRTATPYIDVPGNTLLEIGVAPGTSTGPGDIIATFPVTLMAGETYAVIANGVLDPSGFAVNPDGRDIGFTLFAKAPAREAAMDMSMVEFFALHGSTDAPTVDVIARGVATLVDDAAYGDMTGYLAVPPASYILDVTPGSDNSTIVASFEADLSGLAGGAAVVFASGFLSPVDNQAGPAFGLFAALPDGSVVEFPLYVDTNTAAYERFWIDRDEEPSIETFLSLGTGSEKGIGGTKDRPMLLTGDGGHGSHHLFYAWLTGRQEVPPHWSLSNGVFMAKVDDGYTGLHFSLYGWYLKNVVAAHIHLGKRGENGPPVATLYGPMEPGGGWNKWLYEEGVITEADLMGPLAGQPLTALIDALASGDAYVNIHTDDGEPGDNTGCGDYIMGEIRGQIKLYGTLPEPPMPTTARLQVIHNAADPAAAEVDIYVNDVLTLDDFAFRAATPYIDVPGGVELVIGVAPGTGTGPGDIIATFPVTLMAGETYAVIANGVLDPSMFAANPDGLDIAFTLFPKAGAREAAMDMSMVEFFAFHGSTDAPTVDVIARGVATLVDDAAYGDMTDYLAVPPASYILDVTPGSDNSTIVASFEADLSGLAGGAAVVFASGFLSPVDNQAGPAFGLFAALPNGTVVEFPALTMARLQVIHNAADPGAAEVDIYVNGAPTLDDFAFRAATPYLDVPGRHPARDRCRSRHQHRTGRYPRHLPGDAYGRRDIRRDRQRRPRSGRLRRQSRRARHSFHALPEGGGA